MGFLKEVELTVPPKKQNGTIKMKSLNGYDAIKERIGEGSTLFDFSQPVVTERTKPKVSIGL